MPEQRVRKVVRPPGSVGRITSLSYAHSVKIGLPNYSSTEINVWMKMDLTETDDVEASMNVLKNLVHVKVEEISEERKKFWLKELGYEPDASESLSAQYVPR